MVWKSFKTSQEQTWTEAKKQSLLLGLESENMHWITEPESWKMPEDSGGKPILSLAKD